jgi:NAD(P)-dependent dehydrogenase (short-subunit alcohol dehydrogenase family)
MSKVQQTAVVTGASRGLGAIVARVLAGRGFDLVLNARDEGPLLEVADALTYAGVRVAPVTGDIGDAGCRSRVEDEARAFGHWCVLVNNASELGPIAPLSGADLTKFDRVLATNLIAPVALTQLAFPHLMASGRGLVVNVSSDAARGAYPGWGLYGASKAALDLITRTCASEAEGKVTFVAVDPGDMRTRMHQEAYAGQDISDRPLPQVTAPFWQWLFDQPLSAVNGRRFAAQEETASWLQPA